MPRSPRIRARTAVLTAGAVITVRALPATVAADSGHGLHCGRGHAKHTKALGKTCGKGDVLLWGLSDKAGQPDRL